MSTNSGPILSPNLTLRFAESNNGDLTVFIYYFQASGRKSLFPQKFWLMSLSTRLPTVSMAFDIIPIDIQTQQASLRKMTQHFGGKHTTVRSRRMVCMTAAAEGAHSQTRLFCMYCRIPSVLL